MSLTIVGANGTEIVLNETGIAALPSYTGYGGYKTRALTLVTEYLVHNKIFC